MSDCDPQIQQMMTGAMQTFSLHLKHRHEQWEAKMLDLIAEAEQRRRGEEKPRPDESR